MADAPRNTPETMAWLRQQHERPSQSWRQLCLSLQRQARGLPGVYPSAVSAQAATPQGERVRKISDLRRGMVAYFDDPNDANPFGHIVGIAGWREGVRRTDLSDLLTWTNNSSGGVSLVEASLFPASWGDRFVFGATWLNGYNFAEFDKPPKATRGELGNNYQHAMNDVQKAIAFHRKAGHDGLVKLLRSDLDRMRKRFKAWTD